MKGIVAFDGGNWRIIWVAVTALLDRGKVLRYSCFSVTLYVVKVIVYFFTIGTCRYNDLNNSVQTKLLRRADDTRKSNLR